MLIYEVVASSAYSNAGNIPSTVSFGFYLSEDKAKDKVGSIKSWKYWQMDYESVEVFPREVIE